MPVRDASITRRTLDPFVPSLSKAGLAPFVPKPVAGRAQFDAWTGRKGMTRDAAMQMYVALVDRRVMS